MHKTGFIIFLLFLIALNACQNGAESLPELAGKIFDGLQKNNRKTFLTAVPNAAEMENAFTLYYQDKYPDKEARKAEAINKTASMRLSLTSNFNEVIRIGKEKNIDWQITKIRDLKFNVRDRKEGFQEAKVRMILETGVDKNVVLFDAMRVEKQWYLVENMRWEE